jgi:hypothetical protein
VCGIVSEETIPKITAVSLQGVALPIARSEVFSLNFERPSQNDENIGRYVFIFLLKMSF